MEWQSVTSFVSGHKESLLLLGMAAAVTMRPHLPWPFNKVELLEWFYGWGRDALLTWVSMRGPAHAEASGVEKKTVTGANGQSVETERTISVSSGEEPAEPAKEKT